MSNSRQSTQCDLEESQSHIQATNMTHDDVQNDIVTAFDERENEFTQSANNETFAKPAPSSTVKICLNRLPPISFENKENEDPNLYDL